MRFLCVGLWAAVLVAVAPAIAEARTVRVCNKAYASSDRTMYADAWFAIGFYEGGEWRSSGWWKAGAGTCRSVSSLPGSRFYISVMDHDPRTGQTYPWPGGFSFCTRDGGYSSRPATNCSGEFTKTDFFDPATGPSTGHRGSRQVRSSREMQIIYLFAS